MQNRSIQLLALVLLASPNIKADTNSNQTATRQTQQEIVELKEKVCAALAVLKCTLYKLESILGEIDPTSQCCNDDDNDDDCDDDCPSLDFDNSDNDQEDENEDCDNGTKNETTDCAMANLPVNLNINCHDNQKIKISLKLQTCKKLQQSVNN